MSIVIRGMEMPTDGTMIFAIRPDGMVEDVMGCYVGKAVSIPPHGRLIDADALVRDNGIKEIPEYYKVVCDAPTILEAEEGE